jgi:hypothetical protein
MSKLLVFRENALNQLIEATDLNLEKYKLPDVWVDSFFEGKVWTAPSKIDDLDENLFLLPDTNSDNDMENSLRLYQALHGITLTQATDPRLWTYLAHTKYWKYMRVRWPIEKRIRKEDINSARGSIIDRYFLIGDRSRGVLRHGLARLWWAGYTCYVQHDDPIKKFELAKPLFSKQDIFASLMERAFSKNRDFMQLLLRRLLIQYNAGIPFDDRNNVRSLAKYLVLIGGVTILDGIDHDRISTIVDNFIDNSMVSAE